MQDLEAAIQAKAIIPKAANSEKRPEQVGTDKDRSGGPTLLHHNFGEGDFDFIYLDILRSDLRLSQFS